jgi:hypothetical protein
MSGAEHKAVIAHYQEEVWNNGNRVISSAIPPRQRVTSSAILIFRFADGKIVEEWGNVDALGRLQQLGLMPR